MNETEELQKIPKTRELYPFREIGWGIKSSLDFERDGKYEKLDLDRIFDHSLLSILNLDLQGRENRQMLFSLEHYAKGRIYLDILSKFIKLQGE